MSTFDSIMAETAAICAPLTKAGGAPDGADSPADQQYFVDKLVAVRNFLSAEKDRAADSFSADEAFPELFKQHSHTATMGLWGNKNGDGDDDFFCNLDNYTLNGDGAAAAKAVLEEIMDAQMSVQDKMQGDDTFMPWFMSKM